MDSSLVLFFFLLLLLLLSHCFHVWVPHSKQVMGSIPSGAFSVFPLFLLDVLPTFQRHAVLN